MKAMKFYGMAIFMALVSVCLTACSSDDDGTSNNPIVGTWVYTDYHYDGNVYTCDEGRMLSEMGDDSFLLGNVYQNIYNDLINNPSCKAACISSVFESLPECSSCVYNPFCGTCPVVNLAQNKNIFQKNSSQLQV